MDAPTVIRHPNETRDLPLGVVLTSIPFPTASTRLREIIGWTDADKALGIEGAVAGYDDRVHATVLSQRVGVEGEVVFDAFEALMTS